MNIDDQINETTTKDYIDTVDARDHLLGNDYQKVNLHDFKRREYLSSIVGSLLSVNMEREAYYAKLEQLRSFYLTQLCIDVVSDDAFTEDVLKGTLIDVIVNKKDSINNLLYTNELNQLLKKFSLPSLIEDILEDLLLFGEYCLEMTVEKGIGITGLLDSVPTNSIIALYDSNVPKIFYKKSGLGYEPKSVHCYAHFCIDARKVRVELPKDAANRMDLPLKSPIIRVGRSLFYGALEKIQELYMLEKAASANTFYGLTAGNIVSVGLPPTMSTDDMFKVTQRYESLLNDSKLTSFDVKDSRQILNAITRALSIKVIPSFSDKGALEKVDVFSNNTIKEGLLPTINDYRNSVVQTIGIPPELVFGEGSITQGSRRSSLKQFIRYSKKVKSVQRAVKQGIIQICLNHLAAKYGDPELAAEDIYINMYADTNVDQIENLESVQLVIQGIKDLTDLLTAIKEAPVLGLEDIDFIDTGKFLEYLGAVFNTAGFRAADMIKTTLTKSPKPKKDEDEDEDEE